MGGLQREGVWVCHAAAAVKVSLFKQVQLVIHSEPISGVGVPIPQLLWTHTSALSERCPWTTELPG